MDARAATRFDTIAKGLTARRLTRRTALVGGTAALAASMVGAPGRVRAAQGTATPAPSDASGSAAAISAIAREAIDQYDLKALIVRVTIDGEEVITTALGESMTGVPATTDMHFRNGAVAIAYVATLLLQSVDQGTVGLDDTLATWLPDLPDAERVTPRMLANMTSGYPDYLRNEEFVTALYADPFRRWSGQERIAFGLSSPRLFDPGANWDYSHNGYVILGQALEAITGKPLDVLIQERILAPLGLRNTANREESFVADAQGNVTYGTGAHAVFSAIGAYLAPDFPTPG